MRRNASGRCIISCLVIATQIAGLSLVPARARAWGSADVNVQLPTEEIRALIKELEDSGAKVVGQAGVELRQSIQELADQMRNTIDELDRAAREVIAEAVTQLRSLLNDLIARARGLLEEVNKMVLGAIACISQELANRIAQIKDSILGILQAVSQVVRDAVNRIYVRATQLVDTGTSRIALVANTTLVIVAKIVLIVLAFVMLFWLLRSLWKGSFPSQPAFRFGIPAVIALLVAGAAFLVLSRTALARVFGSEAQIPKWEIACSRGKELSARFVELRNQGVPLSESKAVGDSALEYLNLCQLTSMSSDVARGTQAEIDQIAAVLYPPPPAPSDSHPVTATCPTGSVNPGWISASDLHKVAVLVRLRSTNVIRPSVLPMIRDTSFYFGDVKRVLRINPTAIISMRAAALMHPIVHH
jgi:hypothetical protein